MKNFLAVASIIFIICFLFTSCKQRYSPDIEQVLRMAGNNRSELRKILKHYRKDPADSLKFRAAEFLIVNMPGKQSHYYDAPWNDVSTVMLRWTSSPDKRLVTGTYSLGEPVVKEDVKHITSDYLIDNIELAFKVWQERPWGKHIPFDAFCEDILPYRIGSEPLENWREKVLASFAGLESELRKPNMTAVDACVLVNSTLPAFRMDKDFHDMSYSQSMATTRGSCDEIATYTAFVMRGLGIPVTVDNCVLYTGFYMGHSWNAVRDSIGRYISFMGTETQPGQSHQATEAVQNKIYRKTYAIQKDISQVPFEDRPPLLKSINSLDVSSEHEGFYDVRIPLTVPPPDSSGRVYLAVVGEKAKRNIVARGHIENGHGVFPAMGRATGYFPVYYEDGAVTSAGEPFMLDWAGDIYPVIGGPFKGPYILSEDKPCVIPMINFDIGGEGVAYHESDEINYHPTTLLYGHSAQYRSAGFEPLYRYLGMDPFSAPVEIEMPEFNLANIEIGEWTQYTVEVDDAGTYLCQLRASGTADGKFHLKVDGKNITGSVDIPTCGEWFNWEWYPQTPLLLEFSEGTHKIQFYCEQTGYNVKDLKLSFLK